MKKTVNQLALFDDVRPRKRKKSAAETAWAAKALKAQGDLVLDMMLKSGKATHTAESIMRALNVLGHAFSMRHVVAALKDLGPDQRSLIERLDRYTYKLKPAARSWVNGLDSSQSVHVE